jgi:hypothetical protein
MHCKAVASKKQPWADSFMTIFWNTGKVVTVM